MILQVTLQSKKKQCSGSLLARVIFALSPNKNWDESRFTVTYTERFSSPPGRVLSVSLLENRMNQVSPYSPLILGESNFVSLSLEKSVLQLLQK
jgi:hypothetical protein